MRPLKGAWHLFSTLRVYLKGAVLAASLLFVFSVACTSAPSKEEGEYHFTHEYSNSIFQRTVEDNTLSVKEYDGLINTYQFDATLMNMAVVEAQLWRSATDFKWTRQKFLDEKKTANEEAERETQVFLSFFTPINEDDNLQSSKALWKLFLDADGTRYEGSVNKLTGTFSERQRLFPHHTRFNTPYVVTFKVPVVKVQQKTSKFVLTGPVGTSEVIFEPLSQKE